eukprot:457360-Amphidinium_carterae.2
MRRLHLTCSMFSIVQPTNRAEHLHDQISTDVDGPQSPHEHRRPSSRTSTDCVCVDCVQHVGSPVHQPCIHTMMCDAAILMSRGDTGADMDNDPLGILQDSLSNEGEHVQTQFDKKSAWYLVKPATTSFAASCTEASQC